MNLLKSKKAQLAWLEMRFAFLGLGLGLVLGFAAIFMANKGILIPFKMSFLCATMPATKIFKSKKAQLGWIEGKYFIFGLLIGIILAFAIVFMANKGILIPFKMSFLCPAKLPVK